jgi:chemotaxis protein MotB
MSDDFGEPPHEEHEEEPWLVSYADLMTLLFGFFVLMYTFASAKVDDSTGMVKMRAEVAKYFGGEFTTPYKGVVEKIVDEFEKMGVGDDIESKVTPEGLEVTIRSTTLFRSGSAVVLPEALKVLNILTQLLVGKDEKLKVLVEGHTDDQPIVRSKIYPSNWELSGSRASSVIRLFEKAGFEPRSLVAIGYGSTRPRVPNRDEGGTPIKSNMGRNRRVVIKVYGIN